MMPKGKPDGRVRTKAGDQACARAHAMPERRQRAPAEDPKTAKRPGVPTPRCWRREVERLEQQLAAARKQLAALEARADIDPLTEMPNRRAFERELDRSLAYVKRYGSDAALLYLDLDDFKRVNDRHGQPPATQCSGRWRWCWPHVRDSDVVARIGGDEFALLLWNCDEAQRAHQGAGAGSLDRPHHRDA